ncbi:MAG: hypothetical protein L6R36_002765 [Xanthoria steineri]|nr:MAG: hypothetical protein L6R36_002765 [Xanthoria steineri]
MAEPPVSSAAISAAFPTPPPFYKSFTTSNLARLSSLQETNPSLTLLDLPPELRTLLPPPPPPETQQYRIFGETHTAAPPASTNNPAPLQKEPPNPHRLVNTTRQLLLAFLSLTHCLAVDPDTWAPKWDEMRALLSEAHGIVNEYRPHQARETLIQMMEEQVERCRAETKGCKDVCAKVRKVVEDVESREEASRKVTTTGVEEEEEVHRPSMKSRGDEALGGEGMEKKVWDIIEKEVGDFE